VDEHYVALLAIFFWLQFLCNFDFYEGYMVLVCAGDEEHLTPIWLVKTLSSPNFVPTSPIFCQIEVESECQRPTLAVHLFGSRYQKR
jgi:hypothetical protein